MRSQAFQRKQSAHEAHRQAGDDLVAARQAVERIAIELRTAREHEERAFWVYENVQLENQPRINELNMALDSNRRAAHLRERTPSRGRRRRAAKGASTKKARRQKDVIKGQAAMRRQLIEEIRRARVRYNNATTARRKKDREHEAALRAQKTAEIELVHTQNELNDAKAAYDGALAAYQLRKETYQYCEDHWDEIVAKAGIPPEYHDNVRIRVDPKGNFNIYFGGDGAPDGPNHGHYTMTPAPDWKVTYKREPSSPHGSHNFVTR